MRWLHFHVAIACIAVQLITCLLLWMATVPCSSVLAIWLCSKHVKELSGKDRAALLTLCFKIILRLGPHIVAYLCQLYQLGMHDVWLFACC